MRIRQRRLLAVVVTVALAAAVLPFPDSTPQRSSTPRPAEQALAVPMAPAGAGDGY